MNFELFHKKRTISRLLGLFVNLCPASVLCRQISWAFICEIILRFQYLKKKSYQQDVLTRVPFDISFDTKSADQSTSLIIFEFVIFSAGLREGGSQRSFSRIYLKRHSHCFEQDRAYLSPRSLGLTSAGMKRRVFSEENFILDKIQCKSRKRRKRKSA